MVAKKCKVYMRDDFDRLRQAGKLAAHVLDYISTFVRAGITTQELDSLCHDEIIKHGAVPAPLGYNGYPKSTCISLNPVVCPGIPSDRHLTLMDGTAILVACITSGNLPKKHLS